MSKNISHLSGRKGLSDNLFEAIGKLSEKNGSLSESDARQLAQEYLMGSANVFGAASFYDFTRSQNRDKRVFVCNGSACLTAGSQADLRQRLSRHFKSHEIGEMCCLGRCHENSAFHYQGNNYSGQAIEQIEAIIAKNAAVIDQYHVEALGRSILTSGLNGTDWIKPLLEKMLSKSREGILQEIKLSQIRGRGGAGFPMWIKLDGCAKAPGQSKFIVCNADEGDPGSYSDRYILEHQTEKLLVGMIIAGYVTGANKGVVYIRAEYPESVRIVNERVQEMRKLGLCGENILGSGFGFEFKVIKAQGSYICGEETALLSSIEGQRPEVRVRPPFPVQEGLFRMPTVVNNVETLANLPFILDEGGAAFAAIGTEKSKGTKLVSLDSHFNRPGIYEVEMGTALHEAVYTLGGGFKRDVKALHIGGPLGGLVPTHKISDLCLDFESFASQGFMLGHASIVCVPSTFSMINYLEHLFEFTAHESCGKCFPCRIGSVRGKELLQKAQENESFKIDPVLIFDLIETMKKGSLCALGGGIPLPIYNALQYFKEELQEYFSAQL